MTRGDEKFWRRVVRWGRRRLRGLAARLGRWRGRTNPVDDNAPPRPGFGAPSRVVDCESTDQLHQIFIADGFGLPAALPSLIAENVDATRRLYPAADHHLWDGNALRETIAREFEPAVLEAFDRLQPYAYKADLGRYCLLYLYGGLYVDLGVRCMAPIRPPRGVGVAGFRDFEFVSPSWTALSTGVLWTKPRRPELRIAIDYVVENCRTRFYGAHPLYPTGPALLGRAAIAAMAEKKQQSDADDQWVGVTRLLTPRAAARTHVLHRARSHNHGAENQSGRRRLEPSRRRWDEQLHHDVARSTGLRRRRGVLAPRLSAPEETF